MSRGTEWPFLKILLSYHLVKSFLGPREIFRVLRGSRGSRASRQGSRGGPRGSQGSQGFRGSWRSRGSKGSWAPRTGSYFHTMPICLYYSIALHEICRPAKVKKQPFKDVPSQILLNILLKF